MSAVTENLSDQQTTHAPSRTVARALAVSLACTTFVVVVVNYLIYTARWDFIKWHPEYMAKRPPTISRALSDPRVGEPFAEWMAICAPVLFVGVLLLAGMALKEFLLVGRPPKRDAMRITVLTGLVCGLQGLACVGMVMLSHYRFPDHNDMHMTGSYLFFFSQAFVVVFGEILSRSYAKMPPEGLVFSPKFAQFRKRYVWVPISLGVAYLGLFVIKHFDLGALSKPLYTGYVSVEPLLLSSFLFYVLAYAPDCLTAMRSYWRS